MHSFFPLFRVEAMFTGSSDSFDFSIYMCITGSELVLNPCSCELGVFAFVSFHLHLDTPVD